ncbi:MAG TPA: hypothetical protein ENK25_03900 [Bacteroidetes bacterium]|nr:hypothetical protein [Bacteroidota bacterium]
MYQGKPENNDIRYRATASQPTIKILIPDEYSYAVTTINVEHEDTIIAVNNTSLVIKKLSDSAIKPVIWSWEVIWICNSGNKHFLWHPGQSSMKYQ